MVFYPKELHFRWTSFRGARHFQRDLRNKFGLLLWEDIFRQMKKRQFYLPGVDVDGWQNYTEALDTDAAIAVG